MQCQLAISACGRLFFASNCFARPTLRGRITRSVPAKGDFCRKNKLAHSRSHDTAELQQIKKNAKWVIDNHGPRSGLPQFGYDPESVASLDEFIDQHAASLRANQQTTDRIVSLMGAFLGEAIIATYGGAWQEAKQGWKLSIRSGDYLFILDPFGKVYKRLMNGPEDSFHAYFADFVPQTLSQRRPGEQKKP